MLHSPTNFLLKMEIRSIRSLSPGIQRKSVRQWILAQHWGIAYPYPISVRSDWVMALESRPRILWHMTIPHSIRQMTRSVIIKSLWTKRLSFQKMELLIFFKVRIGMLQHGTITIIQYRIINDDSMLNISQSMSHLRMKTQTKVANRPSLMICRPNWN